MSTSLSDGFEHPLGDGVLTKAAFDTKPFDTTPPADGIDDGYYTAQGFGDKYDENDFEKYHLGEDWNAYGRNDLDDKVSSISNGTVVKSGYTEGLGNYIMIRHDLPTPQFLAGEWTDHVVSLYAHLKYLPTVTGLVEKGQEIGRIGATGGPYPPHLHLEIRVNVTYADASGYSIDQFQKGWIDPTDFINNNRQFISLFTTNDDVVSLPQAGGQFDALGGHDRVIGSSSAETVHGNTGDDVIFDGNGNDFIYGDQDNDYLSATGTKDNDLFDGGSGIDMVSYANLNDNVTIDLIKQTAKGKLVGSDTLVSIENGQGSRSDDTIIGNNERNILDGREGKDTLKGGGGNDDLVGLKGNDTLIGGAGIDTARYDYDHDGNGAFTGIVADLKTGKVKDTTNNNDKLKEIENISGSIFADVIKGNSSANELSGHGGEDYIAGRGGNDLLSGGADADHFVFTDKLNANTNVDTIRDFMHLQDDLYLSKTIFKKVGALLDGSEFRLGNFAQDSDDYIIYDQANGLLHYDANGSAAGGQTLFAKFNPGTALTVDDFSII